VSTFSQIPLKILMLEDSKFDAEFVSEFVHVNYPNARLMLVADEAGFTSALTQGLEGEPYDLVLSDYEVPGYGGPYALDFARAHAPHTPFIFVSGVIGEENAVDLLKRGATDYVSKNRLSRLPIVIDRALREVAEREARDRAERLLYKADAIYGRVVDALNDYAVILLDRHGVVRDWNRGATAIFGWTREQMLGSEVGRLFTEQDRAAGAPEQELAAARRHGSASDDRWLRRADGSVLRADGVLTALHDPDEHGGEVNGFCKIVRDGTRAYEAAEALRLAKDEAEQANLTKDRFLAVLSHELRTPLSPIASAAQLLEQEAVVPAKYRELLPMIRRNVALEARLIEDLLDLTAISAGKVTLKLAPVDVRRLVDVVTTMVGESVRDKRIALTTLWSATRNRVLGDEARLQQVLWNVVRNAVKFTPEDGRIELHVDNDGSRLRIRCIDSGIGIAQDAQDKIFSAFEQADQEVSKRFGGLGLGLSIAQGLVAQHGGTLAVASPGVGQGATFTLMLETLSDASLCATAGADAGVDTDASTAQVGATAARPPAAASAEHPLRMLLVEDNEDAAFAMTMAFEYYGYEVTHAPTLRRALAVASEAAFDVVVTDLGLPDGNGIELGQAIGHRVPLIALSGFGSTEDLRRTAEAGFAEHLVKPAAPQDIHDTVMKVLARARA